MFELSDTVVAICTPKGTGGLAVIRLSGSESWGIAKKIFSPESKNIIHMHAQHGFIKDGDKTIDEVILLPFKSPNSFTAEDTIEIISHGGLKVSSMILDLCLKHGARRARAGEFTFRAFTNGRIDLTEAEAINELINATSEKSVISASEMISGALKNKINTLRDRLFTLITLLEGAIEFPMDVEVQDKKNIKITLDEIKSDLKSLIEDSKQGRVLRDGVKISIVGLPNAGKSSLLNQLLESDRAIVTEIPGTTRDTIEEKIILQEWPIVLIDTAGIKEHKYADSPERQGIERTKAAIKNSDIVLFVKDLTCEEKNGSSKQILNWVSDKPKIVVGNKIDLLRADVRADPCVCPDGNDIAISAKHGINIEDLKKLIVEKIKSTVQPNDYKEQIIFINERQKELLIQTFSSVEFAFEIFNNNVTDDMVADELKKAVSKLEEVSGRSVNEEILKKIFEQFCIGK